MTLVKGLLTVIGACLACSVPAQALTLNTAVNSTGVITDNGTTNFTFTVSGAEPVTTDVNLSLNLSHQDLFDLNIFLISPTSQALALGQGLLGTPGTINTTFDDQGGGDHIELATNPYTATSYLPVEFPNEPIFAPTPILSAGNLLAVFNNANPNGTWTLRIDDYASDNTGTLNSATLAVTTDATPVPFDFQPSTGLLLLGGIWGMKECRRRFRQLAPQ